MKITHLEQTCEACPSQWEFYTEDKRCGYIRYRWGIFTIRLSSRNGTVEEAIENDPIFQAKLGTHRDGYISTEEILPILKHAGFTYGY